MEDKNPDVAVSQVAMAIGEPARARMLCCLMDGHARTATELSVVAEIAPSTASVHLARLLQTRLVAVAAQGKHRYYSLGGPSVAQALEALMVLGGQPGPRFVANTPSRLQHARTCYDHMAGTVAVSLHNRLHDKGWIANRADDATLYDLTDAGERGMQELGITIAPLRAARRRLACACMDWSERRPHLGGSVGAALLTLGLQRGWFDKDLDSRALRLTKRGHTAMHKHFGID